MKPTSRGPLYLAAIFLALGTPSREAIGQVPAAPQKLFQTYSKMWLSCLVDHATKIAPTLETDDPSFSSSYKRCYDTERYVKSTLSKEETEDVIAKLKRFHATVLPNIVLAERAKLIIPRVDLQDDGKLCREQYLKKQFSNLAALESGFANLRLEKGVYETTVQFQKRNQDSLTAVFAKGAVTLGQPFLYSTFPIKIGGTAPGAVIRASYDADARLLSGYILSESASLSGYNTFVDHHLIDLSLRSEKIGGYLGQTAFGATARVNEYASLGRYWKVAPNSEARVSYSVKFSVPIEAPVLKAQAASLKILLLGELEEPYFSQRVVRDRLATIQNPNDERFVARILYAPLKCGLIFNSTTGAVLKSFGVYLGPDRMAN